MRILTKVLTKLLYWPISNKLVRTLFGICVISAKMGYLIEAAAFKNAKTI